MTDYTDPNHDRRAPAAQGWHLDKKVPISLIIAMFLQFAGVIWYAGKIDARVAALETSQQVQKERDERQDRSNSETIALLRTQLQDISSKLDRLIERSPK
jgi:hypothetical protein